MPAAKSSTPNRRLVWILGGALVFVVILLLVSLIRPGESTAPGAQTPPAGDSATTQTPPAIPDLARRVDGDPTALGSVDAPVVLIEFADFRCPFCGVYARQTLPTLVEEYVESGQLRVEWRDVPIFGEQSFDAAVAARAAGMQGMFWEYSEAVFAYPGSDHQDLPRERLSAIAREIGIPDPAAFDAALDNPELVAAVTADATEAQALGVRSTPAFIIGQTPLLGAQPLEAFVAAIDEELERAGR